LQQEENREKKNSKDITDGDKKMADWNEDIYYAIRDLTTEIKKLVYLKKYELDYANGGEIVTFAELKKIEEKEGNNKK